MVRFFRELIYCTLSLINSLSFSCKLMKFISNKSHFLVTTWLSSCDTTNKKFYFITPLEMVWDKDTHGGVKCDNFHLCLDYDNRNFGKQH